MTIESEILECLIAGERRAEEECVKYALRQHLKREPTNKDAKKIKRFQKEGDSEKYWIVFDGVVLGRIVKGKKNTTFERRSDFALATPGKCLGSYRFK